MNDSRNVHENDAPQVDRKHARLADRPERRNRKHMGALLFILCGCLIILGGAGVLAWQLTLHTDANVPTSTTPTSSSQAAKQPAGCTGAREPINVIQQLIAQGFHLTVAQVQAHVLAGKTITQIAAEQRLTAIQLHSIEIQTLRAANRRWQSLGCITQQDVQDNLQRDTGAADYMDEEFTTWFKE